MINAQSSLRTEEVRGTIINSIPANANPGALQQLAIIGVGDLPRGRYLVTVKGFINQGGAVDLANVRLRIGTRPNIDYIVTALYSGGASDGFDLIVDLDGTEDMELLTIDAGTNWPYLLTLEATKLA